MPYIPPTNDEFKTAYPEFESFADALITRAITAGGRMVDDTWFEEDYANGIMLYAAHLLTFNQNAVDSGGAGGRIVAESLGPISVSYERVGTQFDENFLGTTAYGAEFTVLLRLNRGGPRVV